MTDHDHTTAPSEAADRRPSAGVRHGVMLLLAIAAGSAYLTRHGLAVANTTIQQELALNDEQMGWVLGSFAAGYFLCQIPGGWLGNMIGTRTALALLSILWSLMTVWTAAAAGYGALLASRVMFGAAQAGLVPISARIVNDWFSLSRRGLISAVIGASMSVGGMAAFGLTAALLQWFDWRDVFRMYSLVGILWAVVFALSFRTRPQDHPWMTDGELQHIQSGRTGPERAPNSRASRAPDAVDAQELHDDAGGEREPESAELWRWMASSRTIWAINLQAFFRAAAYTFFVTWFPAVLEYRYDSSKELAGELSTVPLAGVILGTMAGGILVDLLLRKTGSRRLSRSGVAFVALGLSSVLVLGCLWATPRPAFAILMSLAAFCSGVGNPCGWAATMDVAGASTSIVMGVMNMAGTLGGFAMPVVLGYLIGDIRRTGGDWDLVIMLVSGVYAVGAVCWLAVDPRHRPPANR